jgi:hypothetical protein
MFKKDEPSNAKDFINLNIIDYINNIISNSPKNKNKIDQLLIENSNLLKLFY